MSKRKKYLVWFKEVEEDNPDLFGEKGVSLAELTSLGLPTPNGFVITRDSFSFFLKKNNLKRKITNSLKSINFKNPEEVQEGALLLQGFITSSSVPSNLGFKIARAYEKMGEDLVAIRSKWLTVLNIKGDANVVEGIRNTWASFFSPQALFLREKAKLDHSRIDTAVVVQKMIQAESSGTIHTTGPLNKSKASILIKAIYGLGQLVIEGNIKPDYYWVDKNTLEITKKELNKQEFELKRVGKITQQVKVSPKKQTKQTISDTKIIELAKLGKIIHQHYFFPQEVEWAIRNSKIYILQTKKI